MKPVISPHRRSFRWLGFSRLVVMACCAMLAVGCQSSSTMDEVVIGSIESEPKASGSMTTDQLTLSLDTFTDRSIRRINYAVTEMLEDTETPQQKRTLNKWRLRSAHAMVSILTDPDPKVTLLDMIVVSYLYRIMAEESGEAALGMDAEPIREATRRIEADIRAIADRVLDEEQLTELYRLTDEWRARHPEVQDYNNVRFNDFAYDTGGETGSGASFSISLFGSTGKSLDDATQTINEARLLGERALRQLKYLPMLTHWEALVLLDEAMAHEQTRLAVLHTAHLAESLGTLSDTLQQLPDRLTENTVKAISEERKAAIDHFVNALNSSEGPMRDVLNELEETLRAGTDLAGSMTLTAHAIESLHPVDPLADTVQPFNIGEYRQLAHDLGNASEEATQMVESLNLLLTSEAWNTRVEQLTATTSTVQQEGEKIIASILRVGVILIALLVIGQFAARILAEYLARRHLPSRRQADK